MKLRSGSDGGCVNNRLRMNYMRLTHIRISSCIRITRCTTVLEERNIYPRLTDSCFGCVTKLHLYTHLISCALPKKQRSRALPSKWSNITVFAHMSHSSMPQCFLHICQHDCTRTEAPYPSFEVIRAVCIIPILNICTALTNVT